MCVYTTRVEKGMLYDHHMNMSYVTHFNGSLMLQCSISDSIPDSTGFPLRDIDGSKKTCTTSRVSPKVMGLCRENTALRW